jgi:hypothetical protein
VNGSFFSSCLLVMTIFSARQSTARPCLKSKVRDFGVVQLWHRPFSCNSWGNPAAKGPRADTPMTGHSIHRNSIDAILLCIVQIMCTNHFPHPLTHRICTRWRKPAKRTLFARAIYAVGCSSSFVRQPICNLSPLS